MVLGGEFSPSPVRVIAVRPASFVGVAFRLDLAAQRPYRAFQMQLAGNVFGDHAVEIAAEGTVDLPWLLA